MRRCALLLAGLLTAAIGLSAQENRTESPAVFDAREWDFGAIREADGPVRHTFTVFNAGERPLRLTRAVPGCTCISATLPRSAIAPGQSAAVEVSFTPAGAAGPVIRTIEIQADGNRSLGVLSISADVLPADRSIQERYPVVLAEGLYASRADLNFGYLEHGQRGGKAFFVANATDRPMRLRCAPLQDKRFRVEAPESLAPGEEARVEVRCDAPADPGFYGSLRAVLEIVPEGGKVLRKVPLSALCVDQQPERDDAPRLRTGSVQLRRGLLSRKPKGTLEIANDGRSPLVIHAIELPDGFSCNVAPDTRIAPGGTARLILRGDAGSRSGMRGKTDKATRLRIFSNDPVRPCKEMTINILNK